MAWIEVRRPGKEHPELAEAMREARTGYPPEYDPSRTPDSKLPEAVRRESIVASHSLIPAALRHIFQGYGAMLDPKLPLSRRQHEMIATTVSVLNDCFY